MKMKRVTGIGGVFFKAKNTDALNNWYRDHLGFKTTEWGATFIWNDADPSNTTLGSTTWSAFKDDSKYFHPSAEPFMFNYRVHNLRQLLDVLKTEGIEPVEAVQEFDYGKFGWIMDPEGRKIELWEPIDGNFGDTPEPWPGPVTGLGGAFFKSRDPKTIKEWYKKHLDIDMFFFWKDVTNPTADARTVWDVMEMDSEHFVPSTKPYMFNYRVKDINSLLEKLKSAGIPASENIEEHSFGKFGWAIDPEGNKMQLWEP